MRTSGLYCHGRAPFRDCPAAWRWRRSRAVTSRATAWTCMRRREHSLLAHVADEIHPRRRSRKGRPDGFYCGKCALQRTGARRHAPGRPVPFLRVRPDDGTDSARAADRPGRRHRRSHANLSGSRLPTHAGGRRCSSRNRMGPSRLARSSSADRLEPPLAEREGVSRRRHAR